MFYNISYIGSTTTTRSVYKNMIVYFYTYAFVRWNRVETNNIIYIYRSFVCTKCVRSARSL